MVFIDGLRFVPMEIYLVQHGEAKTEEEDPQRPLTEKGRQDVAKVAAQLAKQGVHIDRIVHSSKLRAKQTAEIFAAQLKPPAGLAEMPGLAPKDDIAIARDFLETAAGPVMIVGHLPHLDRLSSILLSGNENAGIIAFRYAAVICMTKEQQEQHWKIRWLLSPDLV